MAIAGALEKLRDELDRLEGLSELDEATDETEELDGLMDELEDELDDELIDGRELEPVQLSAGVCLRTILVVATPAFLSLAVSVIV